MYGHRHKQKHPFLSNNVPIHPIAIPYILLELAALCIIYHYKRYYISNSGNLIWRSKYSSLIEKKVDRVLSLIICMKKPTSVMISRLKELLKLRKSCFREYDENEANKKYL